MLRVMLCGGVAVEVDGRRLSDSLLAGRQGRLVFAYLVCERHRSVPRDELAELVWGEGLLPVSWAASLSAVISKLRRLLAEAGIDGSMALSSASGSYRLHLPDGASVDLDEATETLGQAEAAVTNGDAGAAVRLAELVEGVARRGFLTDDCRWVEIQRDLIRDLHVRAVHLRARAHLMAGRTGHAIVAARAALGLDELREASYRLLMEALAAGGERGEALRVYERCRVMVAEELGADPAPETEAAYLAILTAASPSPAPSPSAAFPTGVVTFLLTDIVDSARLWEHNPAAMTTALERYNQLIADAVRASDGVLLKTKLGGDATVSVFPRASAAVASAVAAREAIAEERWPDDLAIPVRMALHTGEAIERDGDYFGPALTCAASLRALASAGQILASQAVTELVREHLPRGTTLRSLGERRLRGLSRGEHIAEVVATDRTDDAVTVFAPLELPIPGQLALRGPFVGREAELERMATEWATATAGMARALLVAGEPGVGKTRLAAEWARRAREQGGLVLYGRCDEGLGAPYQPFAEALRPLVAHIAADRLRQIRGVEHLAVILPEVDDLVPDLATPSHADPDTARYLLFDAIARLFAAVSAEVPVLAVVDDLHWAAMPTLLLLRHLLRSGDGTRLQVVGTYRTTDLERGHPLAGVVADLQRDGYAERTVLGGFGGDEVAAYLAAAGFEDDELTPMLLDVTSGNPFFLIEVLRHVHEVGGHWDAATLPQGVREAVGRRLSRLSDDANEALLVGAVAGSHFSLGLVERVMDRDLIAVIDETRRAGLVVEESGDRFRFNHALVRQTLLAEVTSVRRVRLHQRIAAALEEHGAGVDDNAWLAELSRHYFECVFAGGAAKAVDYSRRAGDEAMSRLAYEDAAELFDRALQALDVGGPATTEDDRAELLIARCEALLAAGDPTAASTVVDELTRVARTSPELSPWATCFAGELAVLIHPERLDATAHHLELAAEQFKAAGNSEGEAKAFTVRASCLARLGRIAECEAALDRALTAARRAQNPRRINAVLAFTPVAALWGPSPIVRARGRCVDVVRVLRITTGSPAVEAVAIRCQAMLEALRGGTETARRMLASARALLESLGHSHGALETDVFAGLVEIYGGEPGDAEVLLRRAYAGLEARGFGVDAAQAAALLARAVLLQGRVDEALALTEDSGQLDGAELKTAIARRAVRAEALAQRGDVAWAVEVARAAVALADATDALIDQADAHVSLARVLQAAGRPDEAETEARRAAELYVRKGVTGLSSALRGPASAAAAPTGIGPDGRLLNGAARCGAALWDQAMRGNWTGFDGPEAAMRLVRSVAHEPAKAEPFPIAVRGERLALCRTVSHGAADATDALILFQVAADGDSTAATVFDPHDVDAAFELLDARYLAGEGAAHRNALSPMFAFLAAHRRQDWRQCRLFFTDAFSVADHRPPPAPFEGVTGPDEFIEAIQAFFDLTTRVHVSTIAVHAVSAAGGVLQLQVEMSTLESTPAENNFHLHYTVSGDKISGVDFYGIDDLDLASGDTAPETSSIPF